jgi:hypothetical protein
MAKKGYNHVYRYCCLNLHAETRRMMFPDRSGNNNARLPFLQIVALGYGVGRRGSPLSEQKLEEQID